MTDISHTIYAEGWAQLYNAFGERIQDEELELMDIILESIMLDEMEKKLCSAQGVKKGIL